MGGGPGSQIKHFAKFPVIRLQEASWGAAAKAHKSLTAVGQHSLHSDGARIMGANLGYVLPRAVLVLLGWGATYWILTALSPSLPPSVVYITGISWVLAGIVCFGYLYALRRETSLTQERPAVTRQKAT